MVKDMMNIITRADGIYLSVMRPQGAPVPSGKDILNYLHEQGVQDLDMGAVNEFTKMDGEIKEQKVSSNPTLQQRTERMDIRFVSQKTKCFVKFPMPTTRHFKRLTYEDMMKLLAESNVRYGIKEDMLKKLAMEKEYEKDYLVAEGAMPKEGTDGYLEFHFDTGTKTRKPKELENGKVDYQSLDLFEMAEASQLLVTGFPEVNGEDGMDVHNVPVAARKVKKVPPLPKGKNTKASDDGMSLFANTPGQIVWNGKVVSISPILEIAENVDNSTGNIVFNGAVVIKGNVVTGFSVEADENIEVYGVVEGAKLTSKQDIILYKGIQGQEKAVITAAGFITVKYAESCTLVAGQDIYADSIMHSNVKCGGTLELVGKRGLLVGGRIVAGKSVVSTVIGSNMATATEIEVGHSPDMIDEYKKLMDEFAQAKADFDKMNLIVETLTEQSKKGSLPPDKKAILLKTINTKGFLREKLTKMQDRINLLTGSMTKAQGFVSAKDVIRPGIKVLIGNAVMYVRDDLHHTKLRNVDGKIVAGIL